MQDEGGCSAQKLGRGEPSFTGEAERGRSADEKE